MALVLNQNTDLVVPPGVRRRAGMKAGDEIEFKASRGVITISAVEPQTDKPSRSELATIGKGEAQIARGEYLTLADVLHSLDRPRRKGGSETARRVFR